MNQVSPLQCVPLEVYGTARARDAGPTRPEPAVIDLADGGFQVSTCVVPGWETVSIRFVSSLPTHRAWLELSDKADLYICWAELLRLSQLNFEVTALSGLLFLSQLSSSLHFTPAHPNGAPSAWQWRNQCAGPASRIERRTCA